MRLTLTFAMVSFVAATLLGASANAKPVTPGSTVTFNFLDPFVPPTGDVVADDTRTVTLTYDPGTNVFDPSEDGTHDVTFASQILRDPLTQRLTFVYRITQADNTGSLAAEAGTFTVGSFGSFATDVAFGDSGFWTLDRAADGSTLTGTSPGQGEGTLPYLVIATDATAFDSNGSMSGTFADEFGTIDAEGGLSSAILSAPLSLSGTFQPITDDGGGGGGGGGTGIPLPASVWTGLAGLAIAALAARVNARRARRLI